jgi:hypothetical protein
MALTDVKVRNLKKGVKPDGTATSKTYKVTDEKGLYVESFSHHTPPHKASK